jgi:hypothetical protein
MYKTKTDNNQTVKTVNATRTWMMTVDAKEYSRVEVAEALQNYRYVGQQEIGKENKYLHWQIMIDNPTPIRFTTLRNAFPIERGGSVRIEPYDADRGSKQDCYNYVTKSETAIHGTRLMSGDWSKYEHTKTTKKLDNREEYLDGLVFRATFGEEPVAKICESLSLADDKRYRQTLEKRQLDYLTQKYSTGNRELTVNYLVGPSRCGKTHTVRQMLGKDHHRVSQYRREPWDQYMGQKKIIIDEFRSQIEFSEMLNILDSHPCELGARYNNKFLAANEIWVISNRNLEDQYPKEKTQFPDDWQAFYARFHNVYRMNARNEPFELIATPAADQTAKFAI